MNKLFIFGIMMIVCTLAVSAAKPMATTGTTGNVCIMDAKQCADGTWVGRAGPSCAFAPCPIGGSCTNVTPEQRDACCEGRGFQTYDVNKNRCVISTALENIDGKTVEWKMNVTGLENAILRVRNNETAEHLRQVMARIQAKTLTKLKEMNNLTITLDSDGNPVVMGKKEAKLLGFISVQKWHYCRILESGNATRKKMIFEYLFKDVDINPCEVK
jgi:hypothetical protein